MQAYYKALCYTYTESTCPLSFFPRLISHQYPSTSTPSIYIIHLLHLHPYTTRWPCEDLITCNRSGLIPSCSTACSFFAKIPYKHKQLKQDSPHQNILIGHDSLIYMWKPLHCWHTIVEIEPPIYAAPPNHITLVHSFCHNKCGPLLQIGQNSSTGIFLALIFDLVGNVWFIILC